MRGTTLAAVRGAGWDTQVVIGKRAAECTATLGGGAVCSLPSHGDHLKAGLDRHRRVDAAGPPCLGRSSRGATAMSHYQLGGPCTPFIDGNGG